MERRCAPITVVSRNFQSLKVPDPRTVTDEYAFMLKLVEDSAPPIGDEVAAMAVDGIDGLEIV